MCKEDKVKDGRFDSQIFERAVNASFNDIVVEKKDDGAFPIKMDSEKVFGNGVDSVL